MSTFSERLKAKRKEKGLTQAQLAEAVGVAMNTVSSWERGKMLPEDENLQPIAEALDTSMWYLLGDPDDKESTFLTDAEAAAAAEAEEEKDVQRMMKLYRDLNPSYQKVARAMVGTLWKMQRDEQVNEIQ